MESESAVIDDLWLRKQEDQYQVRYPVYNGFGSYVPARDLSAIKMKEFGIGVHLVHVESNDYVYKEVDRPLYIPNDSETLELELRNLERMHGNKGVVQLIAIIISHNPYRTTKAIRDNTPTSLQGILLEYYPDGMLQDALKITCTLEAFHWNGIAHMDLKPENIVLGRNLHAILVDINIEAWKQNDIWTLGQILSAMAYATCNAMEHKVLSSSSLSAPNELEIAPVNAIRVKATIGAAT
ncbi:hypothetical protein LSUB1_G002329 [Lachnellula subtilissima]|uniref:Protein kinase domain-containing protein n=1 Tax=Lachnellula subtilissima TaxID=602034 RepID=A0A8H8RY82_9HELO|nr:hypothetical protein LSUB1_G002329 [Lachnellula subtilissima]